MQILHLAFASHCTSLAGQLGLTRVGFRTTNLARRSHMLPKGVPAEWFAFLALVGMVALGAVTYWSTLMVKLAPLFTMLSHGGLK